jgi:cell surface protein SprA
VLSQARGSAIFDIPIMPPDTGLRIPIQQPDNNPLIQPTTSPFWLSSPASFGNNVVYDPISNTYKFQNMTGNVPFGPGTYMDVKEYIDYDLRQEIDKYWKDKGAGGGSGVNRRGGGLIPQLHVGSDVFESIFGSNTIDIRLSGNVELIFGVNHTSTKNYALPVKQRRHTRFNFDQNVQLNAMAKIGDKIEFNMNFNTDELSFDFDNKTKLKYEGKEDDIIQLLEFGDITLPLQSSLITGSQTLFGLKGQFKFGKLTVTAVVSQKKSESESITVSGGAQKNEFYFKADEYEENKHYFIDQYFRDHYNEYLSRLPMISSPIVITKIEVWRTTIGAATNENRNIVAYTDLGEAKPQLSLISPNPSVRYPDNYSNSLLQYVDSSRIRDISAISSYLYSIGLNSGIDYEKIENARLLNPNEYTFNSSLGFISLNTALSADQVLAVAFQYQIIGDDKVYQVGEFTTDVSAPNTIQVKLLKSTTLNTKSPLWKLMMKNVYSLQAYQITATDFRLNVLFTGDDEGVANGFFNTGAEKGIPLIRLMGLDRLNTTLDPYPDGVFDFIDNAATRGGTVNSQNGRIFFPTLEPFGADLRAALSDPVIANKYVFDSLYTNTKTVAQQYTAKNKFYLEGSYKSASGSEYQLSAMNIAEGSVKVTAGGIQLQENVDFTVNYTGGRVTIINEGYLNSGTPITISVENQSSYGTQEKRMFGANLDYRFTDNFNIGATIMNMRERPMTQKVNIGNEPINNTIWGMNLNYRTAVPWVTKLVDFLPFHSTTVASNFQIEAEFAHFIPGHSRAVGKEGNAYIDDFEASKSYVDLKSAHSWTLASTPQRQPSLFPEANILSENPRIQLAYGYNRAQLAWFYIDNIFYNNNSITPNNITKDDQSYAYARAVYETELFPNRQRENTSVTSFMSVLNLNFYPSDRGAFNYDVDGREGFSAGLNFDGTLRNPKSRWGGIMRKMDNTDFEAANYEYIEFWMMDPFIDQPDHKGGKLYFNLGDISEDILKDGKKFFENGLPTTDTDEGTEFTVWGRVPTNQMIVQAFDASSEARAFQDVGYDGLQDSREREFFRTTYLDLVQNVVTDVTSYNKIENDPSGDNYHFFRGTDYDNDDVKILQRYKYYNNSEGNSPTDQQSTESYPTSAGNIPNIEDVNNDNTLNEEEKYYQYVIDLAPDKMVVGKNYLVDYYDAVPEKLPNGTSPTTRWFQFRIPIKNPDQVIGGITGFNSIRFMRLFMRDFEEPIYCRFATFELVRTDWRTYNNSLWENGPYIPGDENTNINIASVGYEENADRIPIPYMLPPGIDRETINGMTTYQVDEKALSIKVTDLNDGDSRAIYKSTSYDLRRYKHLKMFIHAEGVNASDDIKKNDVSVFVRLGLDFTENYYEYEIPVDITPWNCGKDTTAIWPVANRMDIVLDSLVQVKQHRNVAVRNGNHPSNLDPYTEYMGDNKVTVVGMPNIADVTTIMIGIRNPKKRSQNDGDDMLSKSVEIWVNELRLTDFDEKSGFAALARTRLNLADIGDITLAGSYMSPNFGSIEQTIIQRSQESTYNFDFATNIDGGKLLFPEKWNIKIPVHYDYSYNQIVPEYNPLNPDVKMKDDLKLYDNKEQRDSLKRMTTTIVQRQNVNLMNIRKERSMDKVSKMRPWDVENLDFSYSYAEMKSSSVDVEFDNQLRHEGQIGYTFNYNPKNFRPFASVKGLKSKWLQIIKDFNFYLMPRNFTFRTIVSREFKEFKFRPKSKGNIIIDTNYIKSFDWSRNYALQWDLTQNLKLNYRANAFARLTEPQGLIDTRDKRDSIWSSFGKGGRMNQYTQDVDISYMIPIQKIPIFNWITANARYAGNYSYTASALSLVELGNTIQNSYVANGNVSVNMVTLYNNIPYLKKVNQGNFGKNYTKKGEAKKKEADKKKKEEELKKKKEQQEEGVTPEEEQGDDNKNKKKKDEKNRVNVGKYILDGSLRFLMMVRNVSGTISYGEGSVLPGYMGDANILGLSYAQHGSPGFLYVFGGQTNIRQMAAQSEWLTKDSMMNTAFQSNMNNQINFRASIEPFKEVRIDVSANRMISQSYQSYFRVDPQHPDNYRNFSEQINGNFSITWCALGTFFSNEDDLFEQFRSVRKTIADRINAQRDQNGIDPETGYPIGYSGTQQEVLTNAFLATYGGKNIDKLDYGSSFLKIPLPNWRLNYTGLTKINAVKKVFQSISILHNYQST